MAGLDDTEEEKKPLTVMQSLTANYRRHMQKLYENQNATSGWMKPLLTKNADEKRAESEKL